ncbi:MAG: U32 family peptidase [Bacteroidales bacterium]|nr:U32 family peptidase [Bacteroidales bacterium]
MAKPELLLPVGNTESFFAAAEGGADAVYLGLRQFNARNRADNFTPGQFLALLREAKKRDIKVYLTLNTVIKNRELPELLDILHFLSGTTVSALIIQDWGIYYFVKKHFPNLILHASTQMGFHNSAGTSFARKVGFERVILARELTMSELQSISTHDHIHLEMFVHGALCYSFSGMCLFSSYIGGMGANRGFCTQPCRRVFEVNNEKKYLFSLKDNELINSIPELIKAGITSFKVEGRMKSAEYVYRVAKAYRMVIDDPEKTEEAGKLLQYDMGRQKTSYFAGGDVRNALSGFPDTGLFIGTVMESSSAAIKVETSHLLKTGNRIRIHSSLTDERKVIKIKTVQVEGKNMVIITSSFPGVRKGDRVFLAGLRDKKFPNKFDTKEKPVTVRMPEDTKKAILNKTGKLSKPGKEQIFLRIGDLKWLRKIRFHEIDGLIINLPKGDWKKLDTSAHFLKKNTGKIWIELPSFIPEKEISYYQTFTHDILKHGFNQFMLSHLSQIVIIPPNALCSTNENVYTFNDVAIMFLNEQNIKNYIYPFENDFENLDQLKQHDGIVPLYFYPRLFYSRMLVSPDTPSGNDFIDDRGEHFRRFVRDGMTIVVSDTPVSLLQYKSKLTSKGFRKFLIDLSFEKPSGNILQKLIKRLKHSEQVQPSTNFNFVRELK